MSRSPNPRGWPSLVILTAIATSPVLLPLGTLKGQETPEGRVVGSVVDQEKGRPIQGVELRIRDTGLLRVSDPTGRFEFERVPGGPRVLEVTHLSYRVRTDSIQVIPGETLEIHVALSPDPFPLDPLVVSVRSRVLEANGFYVRRDQGLSGVRLTREQILERGTDAVGWEIAHAATLWGMDRIMRDIPQTGEPQDEVGMHFSNEPGLYDPENGFGVNFPDNILVTEGRGLQMGTAPATRDRCLISL